MYANNTYPFCFSVPSFTTTSSVNIISIAGVDFSGNHNNGNLLTKLFFVIKNTYQNNDNINISEYYLLSCNATFGDANSNFYHTIQDNNFIELNGIFLFSSTYASRIGYGLNQKDNNNISGPYPIPSNDNVFFQEIYGTVIDVASNGNTGYIYIAGGENSINVSLVPSIRKYHYSDSNTIFEIQDCSWNMQRFGGSLQGRYSFNSICVYDLNNVVVVGESIITYTRNGGITWTNINGQNSIVNGKILNSVSIYDLSNAIAVGDHGTILYTTDGYRTWNAVPTQFLNLSSSGYSLNDALLNNVSMLSKNEFTVSMIISTFSYSDQGSSYSLSYGSSKILYNYVPALFNNENNYVIDICGNMNVYGNIIINNTSGNINSRGNEFHLIDNAKKLYIGASSELISIGNKNDGNIIINNSTHILHDLSVNKGITVFTGNVDINGVDREGGYLNARGIFLDSLNTGFVYLNGGNSGTRFTPDNYDASYALYIGGYRSAVRIDGSFCVNGDTVYSSGDSYFGNRIISNVHYDQSAIWVKSGNTQFDGSNVTITNGKVNILSNFSANCIRYSANEGALAIPNGDVNVGGNVVINRRLSLLCPPSNDKTVLYIDNGDILCAKGGKFISRENIANGYNASMDCSRVSLEYKLEGENSTVITHSIVNFTASNISYYDNGTTITSDWKNIVNGNVYVQEIKPSDNDYYNNSNTYCLTFSGNPTIGSNSIGGKQSLNTHKSISYTPSTSTLYIKSASTALSVSGDVYMASNVYIGDTVASKNLSGNINLATNISSNGYGIDFTVASLPQHNGITNANYTLPQPFTYYYGNPQSTSLLNDISASLTLNNSTNVGDWISITNISGHDTFYKIYNANSIQIGNIVGSTFIGSGFGATAKFVWSGSTNGWIAVT
jgi:hypothetical protein